MALCGFCLENVSLLNAVWPSSGQNSLFPHTAFHRPGLQRGRCQRCTARGSVMVLLAEKFIFDLQLQLFAAPRSGFLCPCLAVHFLVF